MKFTLYLLNTVFIVISFLNKNNMTEKFYLYVMIFLFLSMFVLIVYSNFEIDIKKIEEKEEFLTKRRIANYFTDVSFNERNKLVSYSLIRIEGNTKEYIFTRSSHDEEELKKEIEFLNVLLS